MGRKRETLAFVLALALGVSLSCTAAQQCNETFFMAAASNPNLNLLTTALSSLASNASVSVIPTPAANITVFAPTDSAFLDLFQSAGLTLGSARILQGQLTGVLLQHVLLNASSAQQLVAEGTIESALGALLNASYPVTVKQAGDNVTVAAKANTMPAVVLNSTMVCGSWLHVVDAVLLPVADVSKSPQVSLAAIEAYNKQANITSAPSPAPDTATTASSPADSAPAPAPQSSQMTAAVATLLPALLMAASAAWL